MSPQFPLYFVSRNIYLMQCDCVISDAARATSWPGANWVFMLFFYGYYVCLKSLPFPNTWRYWQDDTALDTL